MAVNFYVTNRIVNLVKQCRYSMDECVSDCSQHKGCNSCVLGVKDVEEDVRLGIYWCWSRIIVNSIFELLDSDVPQRKIS